MKQSYRIAKLRFASGIHLGSGIGEEYDHSASLLHSDTLSAALCSVWAAKGGDVRSFLESFQVSSAMPLYGGRLFLPLPPDKSCIRVAEDPDGKQHKRTKRLQWIEQPLWEKMACQGYIDINSSMVSHCGKAIAATSASDIHIQYQGIEQKVAVVEGKDNEPYFFDRIYYGKDVELCVLYTSKNEEDFKRSFRLLAANGIGTRRTVGNGLFEVEFGSIEIDIPAAVDGVQLLSLWLPKADEWKSEVLKDSCYTILSRGGYISGSSDRSARNKVKKSVNMIVAGSVIATSELVGNIVDVAPAGFTSHPVWRDGRALCLPFKKLYNDEV